LFGSVSPEIGTVPVSRPAVRQRRKTPALAPLAERGVDALVSTFQQVQRLALDPRAGTGSGLALVLAAREARTLGYAEAIVFDHQGFAVGSATDALFAWVHDCWYTPPAECAHGEIARGVALELLAANDEPFVEHPLREDDLQSADEMLLVGSLRAVTPVIALNGDPVGAGKVGEATARLADWFAARWLPR
ncbi:MAG: aminotransferase class IV, partial [Myxococcota bacterium]